MSDGLGERTHRVDVARKASLTVGIIVGSILTGAITELLQVDVLSVTILVALSAIVMFGVWFRGGEADAA